MDRLASVITAYVILEAIRFGYALGWDMYMMLTSGGHA